MEQRDYYLLILDAISRIKGSTEERYTLDQIEKIECWLEEAQATEKAGI